MTAFDSALDALKSIDMHALRSEVDNLRAIKAWAVQQLAIDYKPGDRVRIVSEDPADTKLGHGWYHYREALAPGQTGIVGEIFFNAAHGVWQVDVGMDRTWSVHDHGGKQIRYWNGPADETPDGYVPPTDFDQERHPHGRVKHFFLLVDEVARASEEPQL